MDFMTHLDQRLKHTIDVLGLTPLAREVLRILALVDCKDELAEELRKGDAYDRPGVLSWRTLAEQVPQSQGSLKPLEQAVSALADWGLIQIVGRSQSDPVAPGPSSLRPTHAGRVCVGLSPARDLWKVPSNEQPKPWTILHGASRERLLQESQRRVGTAAMQPIVAPVGTEQELARLCGNVAMNLCAFGAAVVDGFPCADNLSRNLLHDLLNRTQNAFPHRILLLPEPSLVRWAVANIEAEMVWIEPHVASRRGKMVLDTRVNTLLKAHAAENGNADLTGVPDSDLAAPRRVETRWEDLIVSETVRWQLEQALLHAHHRLHVLPERTGRQTGYRLLLSGLPGTGKSMCAEALATNLNRPLVRLDLSTVLSKWLGETEKLLGQIFDIAEAAGSVLVLDEAESLLRQRSSGQSGGSGTGVAYMLTRLDRYTGVLVATTNRIEDLDEAFFRRFDDYVVLPIPDRPTRGELWRKMLNLTGDEDVDIEVISAHFPISGGLIRGAAIRATAWANGANVPITTPHILASLARELEKNNRSTNEVYIPKYREEVEQLLEGQQVDDDDGWGV